MVTKTKAKQTMPRETSKNSDFVPSNESQYLTILSSEEKTALSYHETIIEKGLETFIEVGQSLQYIRDNRLYRADYNNFADYLKEKWGKNKSWANYVISSSEVVNLLTTNDHTCGQLPQTEAQARPLAKLKDDPELMAQVWEEALAEAKLQYEAGLKKTDQPTHKEVEAKVKEYEAKIEALKKKQEQLTLELKNKDTRIDNIKSYFLTELENKEKELNKSKKTLENQHKQIQELNSLTSGLEKRQHDLAEKEQLIADQFANLSSIIDSEVDVKLKKEKTIALAELEEQKIALKKEQSKIKKELEEVEREKNHLSKNTAWLDLITEFNLEFAKMNDRLKYISHELNKIPNIEDLGDLSDTAKKLRSIQMEKFSDNLEEFGKYNNRIVMSISRIDKNPLKAYEVTAEVIDD